ncbi:MAG: hypothetical protein J5722_07010 [Oscillospiraceae bacterium]|nr:hypothetical protein [Oscillospiraceae bacterium]
MRFRLYPYDLPHIPAGQMISLPFVIVPPVIVPMIDCTVTGRQAESAVSQHTRSIYDTKERKGESE